MFTTDIRCREFVIGWDILFSLLHVRIFNIDFKAISTCLRITKIMCQTFVIFTSWTNNGRSPFITYSTSTLLTVFIMFPSFLLLVTNVARSWGARLMISTIPKLSLSSWFRHVFRCVRLYCKLFPISSSASTNYNFCWFSLRLGCSTSVLHP